MRPGALPLHVPDAEVGAHGRPKRVRLDREPVGFGGAVVERGAGVQGQPRLSQDVLAVFQRRQDDVEVLEALIPRLAKLGIGT